MHAMTTLFLVHQLLALELFDHSVPLLALGRLSDHGVQLAIFVLFVPLCLAYGMLTFVLSEQAIQMKEEDSI